MKRAAIATFAAVAIASVAAPSGLDAKVARSSGLASRKAKAAQADARADADAAPRADTAPDILATLAQIHGSDRVILDARGPTPERFSALLADRVTGERHAFDPKLIELLRDLARRHPSARFELVSGYRSAKLNEMMRKKGKHVASHSQHSLGHAVDFRIVLEGGDRGLDPRDLEKEIRDLGWNGGVGVYTSKSDWFVHADVGPRRRWGG